MPEKEVFAVVVAAAAVVAVVRLMHHHCKDNFQEHFHPMGMGTDTEAHRMASLRWLDLDHILVVVSIAAGTHQLLFPVSRVSMDHYLDLLVDYRAVTVLLDILVDRWRSLAVMCQMGTGSREEVWSDVFELVFALVPDKLGKLRLVDLLVDSDGQQALV